MLLSPIWCGWCCCRGVGVCLLVCFTLGRLAPLEGPHRSFSHAATRSSDPGRPAAIRRGGVRRCPPLPPTPPLWWSPLRSTARHTTVHICCKYPLCKQPRRRDRTRVCRACTSINRDANRNTIYINDYINAEAKIYVCVHLTDDFLDFSLHWYGRDQWHKYAALW